MRRFAKLAAITAFVAMLATPAMASDDARGKELIKSNGCLGCHKLEGSGGSLGPALDQTGSRMSEAEIRQKLVDPKADNPKSMMPSYQRLSEADIEAMVDYLEDLK